MNGKAHKIVGTLAGGGAAAVMARNEEPGAMPLEVFRGMGVGYVGGLAPNVLEPATWGPRHRGPFHSVAASAVMAGTLIKVAPDAQAALRVKSEELRARAQSTSGVECALAALGALGAIGCRLLAGAVAGGPAGYASHLALDFTTPASLPLIA